MTDHIISVNDNYSLQPEVLGRLTTDMRDPTLLMGASQKAQILGGTARSIGLGDFVRDGVLATMESPFAFSKPATGLVFNVGAGKGVVQPYVISTPAAVLTVEAVTSGRYDIVVAESVDTGAGSSNPWFTQDQVRIIRGSSLSDPAIPARCIPLYRIRLANNVTTFDSTAVDNLIKYTAPIGSLVRVAGQADAVGLPTGQPVYDLTVGYPKVMSAGGYLQDLAPKFGLIDRNYGTGAVALPGQTFVDNVSSLVTAQKNAIIRADIQAFGYVDGAGVQTINPSLQFASITRLVGGTTTWPSLTQALPVERELDWSGAASDRWKHFYRRSYIFKATEQSTADIRFQYGAGLGSSRVVMEQAQVFLTIYPY